MNNLEENLRKAFGLDNNEMAAVIEIRKALNLDDDLAYPAAIVSVLCNKNRRAISRVLVNIQRKLSALETLHSAVVAARKEKISGMNDLACDIETDIMFLKGALEVGLIDVFNEKNQSVLWA